MQELRGIKFTFCSVSFVLHPSSCSGNPNQFHLTDAFSFRHLISAWSTAHPQQSRRGLAGFQLIKGRPRTLGQWTPGLGEFLPASSCPYWLSPRSSSPAFLPFGPCPGSPPPPPPRRYGCPRRRTREKTSATGWPSPRCAR